ncbi:Hypothetical Protein FCC1311_048822 [Hondaea fermentalgiana]|uniref:Uncharacterized protein n=1 Tax=Hondaea fermentalgiana TaxID=2315210 RepID=A0A2R5GK55_9STRA|nr:Hypothetical Protein FCC1311_048822 [Hondaea fermentalgiana]|eukprot:GBG28661.1 Hypothetical Protein FCC1311_048822 [Hondaea fermentalgiana]
MASADDEGGPVEGEDGGELEQQDLQQEQQQLEQQQLEQQSQPRQQHDVGPQQREVRELRKALESRDHALREIKTKTKEFVQKLRADIAQRDEELKAAAEREQTLKSKARSAVTKLQENLAQVKTQLEDAHVKLNETQGKADEAEQLREKLAQIETGELASRNAAETQAQERISSLEADLAVVRKQLAERIDDAETQAQERAALETNLAAAKAQIEASQSLEQEFAKAKDKFAQAEAARDEAQARIVNLEANLADVSSKAQEESARLAAQLEESHEQLARIQEQVSEAKNGQEASSAERQAHERIAALEADLADAANKAEEANADLAAVRKELVDTRAERDASARDVDATVRERIAALEAEIAHAKNAEVTSPRSTGASAAVPEEDLLGFGDMEVSSAAAEPGPPAKDAIETHETDWERLCRDLQEEVNDLRDKLATRDKLAGLEQKGLESRRDFDIEEEEEEEEVSAAPSRNEEDGDDNDDDDDDKVANQGNAAWRAQVDELEETVARLQSEREASTKTFAEAENAHQERILALKSRVQALEEDLAEAKRDSAETSAAQSNETKAALEAALAEKQSALDESAQSLSQTQNELAEARRALEEAQANAAEALDKEGKVSREKIQALERKLAETESDLAAAAASNTQEHALIAQLQGKLTDREGAVASLETQLSQAQATANARETALGELETALAEANTASAKAGEDAAALRTERDHAAEQLREYEERSAQDVESRERELASLKEVLRESESDRDELREALARANASIARLEEAEVAMQARHREEIDRFERAQEKAEAGHREALQSVQERQALAVAARIEQESLVERLEDDLKRERAEASEMKRKAKAYVDALMKKQGDAVQAARSEAEKEVAAATKAHAAELETLREELESAQHELASLAQVKDARIKELEGLLVETASATRREAEAIRLTEQEMQSIVDAKAEEVRTHKRLRQQAKKEALSLASQVEDLQERLQMMTRRVDSVLLPRLREASSSARDIEWRLDAALSANEAQDHRSRVQSFGSSGRISSFSHASVATDSSNDGLDVGSDDENDDEEANVFGHGAAAMGSKKEDEENEGGARARRPSEDASQQQQEQRKSNMQASAARVDRLQRQLAVLNSSLARIQGKSREICDLALEETSPWTVLSDSLRRTVEDCFVTGAAAGLLKMVSVLGREDVWVPCTSAESLCEESMPFGAAGVCNVTTGICACPEGYSGKDDWMLFNDCRVNEDLQLAVWVIAVFIAVITFCTSTFGIIYLLCHWNIADKQLRRLSSMHPKLQKANSKTSLSSFDSPPPSPVVTRESRLESLERMPTPNESLRSKRRTKQIRKRQRWTFLSMTLFLAWSFGAIMYYLSFLAGNYRYDSFFAQDFGMCLSATSIFAGLWAFFLIWFQQLPSLRLYGKLFGVESLLIRRPKFVQYSTYARIAAISIINVVLLLIYPYAVDTSVEAQTMLDSVLLIFLTIYVLDFVVTALFLARILYKLFMTLKTLSNLAKERGVTSGAEQTTFNKALATIIIVTKVILVLGPIAVLLLMAAAFVRSVRTRMYLALNLVVLIGNLVCAFAVFIFVFRLAGEKRRRSLPSAPTNMDFSSDDEEAVSPSVSHMRL